MLAEELQVLQRRLAAPPLEFTVALIARTGVVFSEPQLLQPEVRTECSVGAQRNLGPVCLGKRLTRRERHRVFTRSI